MASDFIVQTADSKLEDDCPIDPRNLRDTIATIGRERYWAATRPIRVLGLLNEHQFA